MQQKRISSLILLTIIIVAIGFFYYSGSENLTVYSGRSENLIGPVFDKFTEETGIEVDVRYGGTAELASTILEEGDNTPADVFFAQDAGGLGALTHNNRLQQIPDEIYEKVDSRLRSPDNFWIGTSGRARVISYNSDLISAEEIPNDIWEFTEPEWENKIGWAPTNGSFQTFITALRIHQGEEQTLKWLEGIKSNNPLNYENNTSIVNALGRGEIEVGFVNHYYLFRFLEERGSDFPVNNHYTEHDAGAMINIAGIGILNTTSYEQEALQLAGFLLTPEIQEYFVQENYEYPVTGEVSIEHSQILPLDQINAPDINLTDLEDLEGTLELLREAGVL